MAKIHILGAAAIIASLSIGVVVQAQDAPPATMTAQEAEWLDTHNIARARYGRAPLVWDAKLAKDADDWARHLATTETFDHAEETGGQGENLWMGSVGGYSNPDMVNAWVAEEQFLISGTFPNVSTTGNWLDVGHATQLLWPDTTHVGCSIANSAADAYMVCRYTPQGNWVEEFFDAKQK